MASLIESKHKQLERTVFSRVTEDSRTEGRKRYGNWASQQKNYRWDASDYNHRGFRAVYFEHLFQKRAELICEELDCCDSDLPNFLEKDDTKVVSFGCGQAATFLDFINITSKRKTSALLS